MQLGALGLALLLSLAGCASPDKETEDPTSTATQTSSTSATSTGSTTTSSSTTSTTSPSNASANAAPSITSFTANATGLVAAFAFNGTDADGDSLTFTLSFGDDSNETGVLPQAGGNATHAYAAGGSYNITLMLADAGHVVNQTITLNVTSQGAAGAQHESGEFVAVNVCQGFFFGDLDGIAQLNFDVDPATLGLPYEASVDGEGLAGLRLGFFDTGGANVGGANLTPGTTAVSGTVPDSAVSATLQGCGGGPYTATYDAGGALTV